MKKNYLSFIRMFLTPLLLFIWETNFSFMLQDTTSVNSSVRLFLCGDVMPARGIDQILPFSVDSILYESYVKDARDYVKLAERKNGSILKPVSYNYIWGDAIKIWEKMLPEVKIINLETSITTHNKPWAGKGINYRMHPKNVAILTNAKIDYCSLANNHTLDWERQGLIETVETLKNSNIAFSGAGRNIEEASKPIIIPIKNGRIIIFSFGAESSGIPKLWAAKQQLSGLNILPNNIDVLINLIKNQLEAIKKKNDIVVFSVHWGGNWGYNIPSNHKRIAHEIIDNAGIDIVLGHSSHHPMGIEVYKNKLIIYGAGDFINDYEGIQSHGEYKGELSLMYFPSINITNGQLISLKVFPMEIKKFKLNNASKPDVIWLKNILNKEGKKLNTQVKLNDDNSMDLKWD